MTKNTITNTLLKVKKHVAAHKVSYVLGAALLVSANAQRLTNRGIDEFLTEKGIDPNEFWDGEDYPTETTIS